MTQRISIAEFNALMREIGAGLPSSEQYRAMGAMILDVPAARGLMQSDPFLPGYREAAMEVYLALRGRAEEGYVALRDEAPAAPPPRNPWTDLVPWSFRDAGMTAEHLFAWGHILSHLGLPAGGSVLEYGPGSGQLLLMLSRMGYAACGVDIEAGALDAIQAQSTHLGLTVETERAVFGEGFAGRRFDAILFYEAFHHAFDFEALLAGLHDRLNPGGRLVLCGEPILPEACDAVPYPWGPRLDALSVFCIQRFGWMELGFTQAFFLRAAERAGWTVSVHPFPATARAAVYVLQPTALRDAAEKPPEAPAAEAPSPLLRELEEARRELEAARDGLRAARRDAEALRQTRDALLRSTSWRLTAPLRAIRDGLKSPR